METVTAERIPLVATSKEHVLIGKLAREKHYMTNTVWSSYEEEKPFRKNKPSMGIMEDKPMKTVFSCRPNIEEK